VKVTRSRGPFIALWVLAACVTSRPEVLSGGDSRLDDGTKADAENAKAEARGDCGPDAKGDVVLLDSRTGGPLTCALVTVSMEPDSCPNETTCPSEVLFQGHTNRRGQFASPRPFSRQRLAATVDGYGTGTVSNATLAAGKILELEMPPDADEGFWLKVVDGDGNYLQDLLVTFKQGDDVLATLRSNVLANVFFTQRNPFSGEGVMVQADGYAPAKIASTGDLGDDGHTLTLKK
jgi:hypothetical protein